MRCKYSNISYFFIYLFTKIKTLGAEAPVLADFFAVVCFFVVAFGYYPHPALAAVAARPACFRHLYWVVVVRRPAVAFGYRAGV